MSALTLKAKPEAVKMLNTDYINLMKRHGYKITLTETGIVAKKHNSHIYGEYSLYNENKVTNFEVFSSLYRNHDSKLDYVWQLRIFIRQHDTTEA